MQSLEETVKSMLSQAGSTSSKVTSQIEALRTISGSVLSEASAVATDLESRTQAISDATNAMADAHSRVDKTLSSKQGALETMLHAVGERAEDLDSIVRSFSALIDDSLRNAEQRARQIGAVLSENAQSTTEALGSQFETIRNETGKERERTASALRQSYDQAIGEMQDVFAKLTSRFEQSAQQLKTVSSDISRDLETTRSELQRTSTELPREAKEATAAVRRVVADQVKALAELTEIVGKAGQGLDIAEARPTSARVQAPAPAPEPRRVSMRQDYAPKEFNAPAPAPARNDANVGRGAWLSELLSRASSDESPAPASPQAPPRAPQSLDSLSVDIARMIDHDAVVDLWDRYRNGEQNIFSRRLYTLKGQQTFDEIRRRYRRDSEFSASVDRYVDQFETLLSDMSDNGRDDRAAKKILTSDNGKVYTMLAHASGRFE